MAGAGDAAPGWVTAAVVQQAGQPAVMDRRLQDGPGGCRVAAVRVAGEWRFVAWGPVAEPELSIWAWAERYLCQERYGRGERMPQRSVCLGSFGSGAAARAACKRAAGD